MQANPRTITALFEPTQRYVVPMFQRHYVWTKSEQWEPLWYDVEEKHEARRLGRRVTPHFLGAVILDSARRTSTKQVSRFIVIDGQQRILSTVYFFDGLFGEESVHGKKQVFRFF